MPAFIRFIRQLYSLLFTDLENLKLSSNVDWSFCGALFPHLTKLRSLSCSFNVDDPSAPSESETYEWVLAQLLVSTPRVPNPALPASLAKISLTFAAETLGLSSCTTCREIPQVTLLDIISWPFGDRWERDYRRGHRHSGILSSEPCGSENRIRPPSKTHDAMSGQLGEALSTSREVRAFR